MTLHNDNAERPLPVGSYNNYRIHKFENLYARMLKNMSPWQAKQFNCRVRRAVCSEYSVMNFGVEPIFAKRSHKTLMTLIALMTLARSFGCIAMAGDGNATTQRLYNASRADE